MNHIMNLFGMCQYAPWEKNEKSNSSTTEIKDFLRNIKYDYKLKNLAYLYMRNEELYIEDGPFGATTQCYLNQNWNRTG
jgi:hypothetical protein